MRRLLFWALLALLYPSGAQSQTFVAVDVPAPNAVVRQPFMLAGWALDFSSQAGPGVNVVHVWARPSSGAPPTFVGALLTVPSRPDVAAAFGAQFLNSAYGIIVKDMLPGVYSFELWPFSTVTNSFGAPAVLSLTVLAQPYMWVDSPPSGANVVQPFNFGGWAVDLAASTGTGVNTVHLWAFPTSGAPPIFVGVNSVPNFGYRPDVGNYFGNGQFNQSGFNIQVNGLPPGTYNLVASAWSLVGNGFTQAFSVPVDIDRTLATPVIQPNGGVFGSLFAINISAEPGAQVYCTLAGDTPTTSSTPYTGPFQLLSNALVRARAFKPGTIPSGVAAQDYWFQVADPVVPPVSGTHPNVISISVTSPTPGATIYWTDNGTEPSALSTPYTGPLTYTGERTFTFKAKAFKPGWLTSGTVTRNYTINTVAVQTPAASPGAGTYDVGQIVQLTVPDSQAQIRYTTNGTVPTETSTLYLGSFALTQPTVVTARAFRQHYPPSAVLQVSYAVRVPTPVLSPPGGEFTTPPLVTISVNAPAATIRYTVDGETPVATSEIYSQPIQAGADTTIMAAAFRVGWAQSRTASHTYVSTNVLYPTPSPAAISLSSNLAGPLQPIGAGVLFTISGAAFANEVPIVTLNGVPVETSRISYSSSFVSVPFALADGINDITLSALDTSGAPIEREMTLWAGARSFTVNVTDAWNFPLSGIAVSVQAAGEMITLTGLTNASGAATFVNVPATPLRVQVEGTGYLTRVTNGDAFVTSLPVRLDIDDNDFAYDGEGWDGSGAVGHVFAGAHLENTFTWFPCATCPVRPQNPSAVVATPNGVSQPIVGVDTDAFIDTTATVAPQTITRVFNASEGATEVSVRYRFISTEFFEPAVRANDSYNVTIRNMRTQQVANDTRGVLALLGVATVNGQTPWRTLSVAALPGDPITVTATVANAVDNAHVSVLQVDRIVQQRVFVSSVTLNDMHYRPNQIETLRYLSATPHPAYQGYTRIHGTMTIQGPVGDTLTELRLEFRPPNNPNSVIATAEVAPEATALLLRAFDANGRIAVTASQLLFRVSPAQLSLLGASTERRFAVWVTGRTQANRVVEAKQTAVNLRPLSYYQGANVGPDNDLADCVYPPGWRNTLGPAYAPDYPCGGGAWARRHVPDWAAFINATLGDFSNMNGLRFPIHGGHQHGLNTDGTVPGIANRTGAATAQRLIEILRLNYVGINRILITHDRNIQNPNNFFRTLLLAPALPDGRRVHEVIINYPSHADHFHINWRDRP